jgi:hypothetical protein
VDAPTSIPILETTRVDDLEIGWIALHVYPDEFTVRYAVLGSDLCDHRLQPLTVTDAEGRVYSYNGAGGGGGDRWHSYHCHFEPALDLATTSLHLDTTVAGMRVQAEVQLGATERCGAADVVRSEQWPSPRWDDGWKPAAGPAVGDRNWRLLSFAPVADEIVPLGAPAGDVAGGALTFLSLERWGDAWQLHHHWVDSGARMYSPLHTPYLELEFNGTATIATFRGGGTEAWGFRGEHGFVADPLPPAFVLRRPAADGGPPLVEAEIVTGL